MEKGYENVSVIYTQDVFLLFNIVVDIQPLLKEENLQIRHGVTLFTESKGGYESLMDAFRRTDAAICKSIAKKEWEVRNNQLALHPWGLYEKDEIVAGFLEEERFTPAVFVYGFVPEQIIAGNLLVFEEADFEEVCICLKSYLDNIHKQPDTVQRELRCFKTSNEFLQRINKYDIFTSLIAAANVFCSFYREVHTEEDTKKRYAQFREAIAYAEDMSECNAGEFEMADAVKKAVEAYVDEHPEVVICHADEVDGKAQKAVEDDQIILYDSGWYYLSDKLLGNACKSLRCIVSLPKIKEELCDKGILWCNNLANRSYTVKKQFVNVYGYVTRQHFIKIRRDFFETFDSFGLEERRCHE